MIKFSWINARSPNRLPRSMRRQAQSHSPPKTPPYTAPSASVPPPQSPHPSETCLPHFQETPTLILTSNSRLANPWSIEKRVIHLRRTHRFFKNVSQFARIDSLRRAYVSSGSNPSTTTSTESSPTSTAPGHPELKSDRHDIPLVDRAPVRPSWEPSPRFLVTAATPQNNGRLPAKQRIDASFYS